MLKTVRMSERTDYTYEVIFDWDNDRHWAVAFNKGDSIDVICNALRRLEAGIRNDEYLKDQNGNAPSATKEAQRVMTFSK